MILRIQTSRILKKRPSVFFILIVSFLILSCKREVKEEAIKPKQVNRELNQAEKLVNEAINLKKRGG